MKSNARTNLDHSTLIAAARWICMSVGAVGFALLGYSALIRKSHADVDAVTVKPTASSDSGMRSSSFSATARPIEQLKVGDRVLARNPEVTPEERAAYVEPEWSEWVHLSLEMPKPDGYVLSIEMLRPESWVRSQLALVTAKRQSNDSSKSSSDGTSNAAEKMGASEVPHSTNEGSSAEAGAPESSGFLPYRKLYLDLAATSAAIETETDEVIGAVVELDLPELGLTGPAIINGIETAPEVKRGEGRVITATFHHSSGDVIDLVIGDDKSTETIGTTSNHPFWSVDRQEYVQAGSLHQGERVLTLQGDTKRIVSHLARPGPQPVFNLEVFAEHVYYVGGDGVLVHNNGDTYGIHVGTAVGETELPQTAGTGGEWYEHFAKKYGAENVDWVSGSGRTIDWPSELPHPGTDQLFRVTPIRKPWYLFHRELQSVAGPRAPGAIGHHNQPLYLNGIDDGALNGSWQFNPSHQIGHSKIDPQLSRLPNGTEIRIKPPKVKVN